MAKYRDFDDDYEYDGDYEYDLKFEKAEAHTTKRTKNGLKNATCLARRLFA